MPPKRTEEVRANVRAYTNRLRQAGGKRTSIDLDAEGVAILEDIKTRRKVSTSGAIALALVAYKLHVRKQ